MSKNREFNTRTVTLQHGPQAGKKIILASAEMYGCGPYTREAKRALDDCFILTRKWNPLHGEQVNHKVAVEQLIKAVDKTEHLEGKVTGGRVAGDGRRVFTYEQYK